MSHGQSHHVPETSGTATGYEVRDANIRTVLTAGVVLTVVVVVVMFGLLKLYDWLAVHDRVEPEPEPRPQGVITAPTLHPPRSQDDVLTKDIQREQLLDLHKGEDAELTQYGWVNREAKVVRVPIDRAIDLVVERGVPAGKGPKTETEINSHDGSPVPPPSSAPSEPKK